MSPLAFDIYAILRTRVQLARPELSHSELVESLPSPFNELDGDSPIIATALDELAITCRSYGLPPITAMVVRTDSDRDPASDAELRKVRSSSYPPALAS
jgi:hypothetical protein